MWKTRGKSNPYGTVTYGGKTWKPHRLAYVQWVGPLEEGDVVRHGCDTPGCIEPTHLVKGTQQQNIRDMMERGRYRAGRKYEGADHVNAVVSEDVVRKIRAKYTPRKVTYAMLADEYGISMTTVWRIITGERYRNVD